MAKLKCPRCGRKSALKRNGWAEDGRYYDQKVCGCGYEGKRNYMSLDMSNRLRERIQESHKEAPNG